MNHFNCSSAIICLVGLPWVGFLMTYTDSCSVKCDLCTFVRTYVVISQCSPLLIPGCWAHWFSHYTWTAAASCHPYQVYLSHLWLLLQNVGHYCKLSTQALVDTLQLQLTCRMYLVSVVGQVVLHSVLHCFSCAHTLLTNVSTCKSVSIEKCGLHQNQLCCYLN